MLHEAHLMISFLQVNAKSYTKALIWHLLLVYQKARSMLERKERGIRTLISSCMYNDGASSH